MTSSALRRILLVVRAAAVAAFVAPPLASPLPRTPNARGRTCWPPRAFAAAATTCGAPPLRVRPTMTNSMGGAAAGIRMADDGVDNPFAKWIKTENNITEDSQGAGGDGRATKAPAAKAADREPPKKAVETSFRADNGDLVENPFAKYITGASAGASSSSSSGAIAAAATSSPSAFSKEVDVEVEVVVEAAADEAAAPPSAAAAAVAKVSKRPVSLSPAPPRRMSNDDMGISGGTNGGGSRVPSRVPFFYPALLVGGALVGSAFGAGLMLLPTLPTTLRRAVLLAVSSFASAILAAWLDVKILAATCAELAVGAYNGVGWLVVASGQAAVGAAVGTTNGVFWLMTTFVQAAVAAAAYFGAVAQGYLNAVTSVALAAQALAFGALARTLTLVGAGAQRTAGAVTGGAAAVATGGASGASAAASGVSSVAASGAAAVNVAAQSVASLVSAVYQAVLHVVLHAAPTALLAGLTQLRLLLVAIATAVAAGATSLGTAVQVLLQTISRTAERQLPASVPEAALSSPGSTALPPLAPPPTWTAPPIIATLTSAVSQFVSRLVAAAPTLLIGAATYAFLSWAIRNPEDFAARRRDAADRVARFMEWAREEEERATGLRQRAFGADGSPAEVSQSQMQSSSTAAARPSEPSTRPVRPILDISDEDSSAALPEPKPRAPNFYQGRPKPDPEEVQRFLDQWKRVRDGRDTQQRD